ncbi:MerR family transcriptional regulator [Paenibacillus sp. FSL K6-1122]|uniref:MerR family transcriptional regulator n=1 Tax=Paenibacillus TaxID=44249 RepID=UPI0009FA803B|nr:MULTISPECIES: MerR family transcriptional regulator [Paenibacillus]PKQ87842.1 MerR family transcriptional regulator [Paenibacillus sp. BGI2013]
MAFSIKEASEQLGCPAHKIRYYEKEGMLPYIQRDQHRNRMFEEEHLDWMRLMSCFRATGMKVSTLKQMVSLALDGDSTIPQRKAILHEYKRHNYELYGVFWHFRLGKQKTHVQNRFRIVCYNSREVSNFKCK